MSVGAQIGGKFHNQYWTGGAGRYIRQRPVGDTEGSWTAKMLIYANDRSVIRGECGILLPSQLGGLGSVFTELHTHVAPLQERNY